MKHILLRVAFVATLLCLTSTSALGQVTDARKFLICHTGSVATAEDAQPYIDGFGSYLAKRLGWGEGTWEVRFENKRKKGVGALREWTPAYATLSLGIFLEKEKSERLKPLVMARVNGRTNNKYYVLVQKGAVKSLDELAGKSLAGSVVDDPDFLSKVVFAGKLDAGKHFVLQQTARPLRAIRKVTKGKLDAVLVDDIQFQSLKGLPLFAKLDVVYESADIPNLGMVYVEGRASADDIRKFADALVQMCKDAEGKKMCESFAVEGFEHVPAGALDGVRKLYQ